ncbi:XdhC family protein [Pelagovum sp. HNIBRBA483]|uniref:XdhC family protein n=1 Tax=Pelagovum sp. HNIBRBA483 TaxID=3233341 RepID=UPI0034A15B29
MAGISAVHSRHDPVSALVAAGGGAVLAVIAETSGPSYRPVGAMMAVLGRKEWVGTLSSGCVEADIALHALEARSDGEPRFVAYGKDSPFMDIQLPCGGGLKILLVPNPDLEVLENLKEHQSQRRGITLEIEVNTGRMELTDSVKSGLDKNILRIRIGPELKFFVFGKGPEAGQFAALVQTLGYENLLLSPDDETLGAGDLAGCDTHLLTGKNYPQDLAVDHRTAIV